MLESDAMCGGITNPVDPKNGTLLRAPAHSPESGNRGKTPVEWPVHRSPEAEVSVSHRPRRGRGLCSIQASAEAFFGSHMQSKSGPRNQRSQAFGENARGPQVT